MKRLLLLAILVAAPAFADETNQIGELDHSAGRVFPQVSFQADQLSYTLSSLSQALATRAWGSPVVYQAQRVAQAAQTFAWNTRYSDYQTILGSFGWLRSQYDNLEDAIYNSGIRWDGQVSSLTGQARYQIGLIERALFVGPGPDPVPGPGPFPPPSRQNWVCYAVDNGWEEHGSNAHAGYGRDQWEAQRDAVYNCQLQHGSCRVTSCRILQ